MRRVLSVALVGLVISACTPTMIGVDSPARKPDMKRPDGPDTPKASEKPQVTASTAPKASPTPGVPTRAFTGTVRIDANYVVSAGGGNVISAGGGNVISAGGGNVISAGGGNVISAGGGNYALLADDALPIGTILPVQGMEVSAIDLSSGETVAGPVATDAEGRYTLAVPESVSGNILFTARIPAKPDDPRLRYDLIIAATESDSTVIDEDSALAHKYIQEVHHARFEAYMTQPVESSVSSFEAFMKASSSLDAGAQALILAAVRAGVEKIHAAGQAAGIKPGDPRIKRMSQYLLAKEDLAAIQTEPGNSGQAKEPALVAFREVCKQIRLGVEAKLVADPAFETNNPTGLRIQKPTDLGDYIVSRVAEPGSESELIAVMASVMSSVGLDQPVQNRLLAATLGVIYTTGRTLFMDGQSLDEALKLLEETP